MLKSIHPPKGISEDQMVYFEASMNCARKLVDYYNRKDWIDDKGKKGNMEKEYVGYITENEINPLGKMEEITSVRGEITVDISAEDAHALLLVNETAPKFDTYLKFFEVLDTFSDQLKVMRLVFKGILMVISERETVITVGSYKFNNGISLFPGASVEHPGCPLKKSPV